MADKKEVAVGKRIKIDKTMQQIMLFVLAASIAFGVAAVLSVYFIKYIGFNNQVIEKKDESINNYYTAIKNVGICIDKNKDGKYTDAELKDCNPETVDVTSIPNTLRYNVLVKMAQNTNLESVGREALEVCYDAKGKRRDFTKAYYNAKTTEEKEYQLQMLKMCSSLRVIPDALPSGENQEALLASLNQVFIISDWEPEAISPSGGNPSSPISGVLVIPIALSIEADQTKTMTVLNNIERSIRIFEITSATIAWSGSDNSGAKLKLSAQARSYYAEEKEAVEDSKIIYASKEAKKAKGAGGE